MRLLAEQRAPTSASSFVSGLKVNTVILSELATYLLRCLGWSLFPLHALSLRSAVGVFPTGFRAASMLLMLSLIAHFWRAVATADWGRLSIVVALGVLVGFYLRSRAGLFAQQGP